MLYLYTLTWIILYLHDTFHYLSVVVSIMCFLDYDNKIHVDTGTRRVLHHAAVIVENYR